MQGRLFSKTGATKGAELELSGETLIGRDRKSALIIDQPLMSGRHARIFYDEDDGRFVLEDLDSLNGTELDGDRVSGAERLGHLHVITFAGTYDFFFQDLERCAQRHPGVASNPIEAGPDDTVSEPRLSKPEGGPSPPRKSAETTRIDQEPIGLPGFLAQRAEAASDDKPSTETSQTAKPNITKIDDKPAFLPQILAKHADKIRAESGKADADAPARAPAGTVLEKMPVVLPGNLAQRIDRPGSNPVDSPKVNTANVDTANVDPAKPGKAGKPPSAAPTATPSLDVRKAETVDMSDIEDLIIVEPHQAARPRPGQLYLVVTNAEGLERSFTLEPGENVIGRSARVQVSLNFRALSRRHATLTLAGNRVTVRDLGSRNHTFLDGEPIEPETEIEIQSGALLRFGSVEARLAKDDNS